MVQLTRIYTRGGDRGQTSLGDGTRVPKDDLRVEAFGTVDEANAAVGLVRLHSEGDLDALLSRIQNDLFDLGADLCTPEDGRRAAGALRIVAAQVERLEDESPRPRQAGGRLQRQDPGEGGWTGVETANVKMSMNPFDEIAVEEAVRLKEAGKATEIVAVSIGPRSAQETIRTALAMGADRGILVETDRDGRAAGRRQDAEGGGRQGTAEARHPRQAGDRRRRQPDRPDAGRAARLAAGTFASKVKIDGDKRRGDARGRRRAGDPPLTLPAVVTTDLRLNEPRYASLPNIMKAKKKPIDEKTPGRSRRRRRAAPQR
jgi:electron transfer flavoprotein beta subunit